MTRTYRLRIRNAADDAWEHTFTAFAKPPSGVGAQRVYPLQGKTTSKPWVVEVVDDDEDVTAALAEQIDGYWRYTLLRRLADISVSDDGGAYVVQATGRISDITLSENQAVYRITISDERAAERAASIFTYSNTTQVYPPGTRLTSGFYTIPSGWGDLLINVTMTMTKIDRAEPITSVRFDTFNNSEWPSQCVTAVNDDALSAIQAMTSTDASTYTGGCFHNLRCSIAGNDYPVFGFAYTNAALSDDVANFPVGERPLKGNDNPVGVYLYDPTHALSGVSNQSGCYFYFGRTAIEGLPEDLYDPGRAGYPPTSDIPLHIQGQPFDVLQDIYDGVYSLDGQTIAYDSTQMAALQADPRFAVSSEWRITRGNQNMAKWCEDNIYKPFLVVPLVNATGEVYPQPLLLPDANEIPDVSALDILTAANVTAPVEWRHGVHEQITELNFIVPSRHVTGRYYIQLSVSPEFPGSLDRFTDRTKTHTHTRRIEDFGTESHDIIMPAVYSTDSESDNGDGTEQFVEAWAREWLDRWGDGPVYYTAQCLASVTAAVGDFVVVDSDTLHTPNAGIRTGDRIAQVVSRSVTVAGVTLELLDAGPYVDAVSEPTVYIVANANDPRHTMRVTISGLGINSYELQMARGIAAPATLDFYMIAAGTETVVDVGGLPSGTGWTVRARAIGPQRIRSDWSTIDNASTIAYSAPTAVSATASDTDLDVTWTNTHDELETRVYYNTSDTLTGATLFEQFQPGTESCTIAGLTASTLYYVLVTQVGPYGTETAADSDSATTGATPGTLTAPDEIWIELGVNSTTRTAP